VKAEPSEEARFIHGLDDGHHPEDEENRLPVLIMEKILRSQNEDEGQNSPEDRCNRPAHLFRNDESIGENENSQSDPLLRCHSTFLKSSTKKPGEDPLASVFSLSRLRS